MSAYVINVGSMQLFHWLKIATMMVIFRSIKHRVVHESHRALVCEQR